MPTYSNGQYNPNPLANPFNTRIYGNYSLNPCSPMHTGKMFNPNVKSLPEPKPIAEQDELHAPMQDIPISLNALQGFADSYAANKTWNDDEIYSLDYGNSTQLSKRDIEYWKEAEIKTAELSSNMSDEQKQMLSNLANMFPKSKFEDENA